MNRRLALPVLLMWLGAVPFTVLDYWRAWDRLPTRMAVHFDANWHANGWASRERSFELAIAVVLFMLIVFTIVSYAITRPQVPTMAPRFIVVFFCVVMVLVCGLNHWVVQYNLRTGAAAASRACCAVDHAEK